MENKLKKLFEYQRFEGNPRLAEMIRETEERYAAHQLEDDLLCMVNAAGEIEQNFMTEDSKDGRENLR